MAYKRIKGCNIDDLKNALAMNGSTLQLHAEKVKITRIESECSSGKVCYLTAEDAIKALKVIKRKHFTMGSVKWYKCPECGFFYTTSKRTRHR